MPYPNEHSCRLEEPDQYEKIRREKCGEKHDGKCIDVIYGIKDGKSEIQALRYKTEIWDEDDARAHCKERGGSFEPASEDDDDRELGGDREVRTFHLDNLELRQGDQPGEQWLTGHGAVYDKWSVDLGGFTELFEQKTFTESIKRDDIRSLRDHNSTFILGRNRANTLVLEEDKRGVKFDVLVPDTSYGRDLVVSVERGDVTGCSIIFSVDKNGERWYVDGEEVDIIDAFIAMWDAKKRYKVQRRINKARLYDIGPVTFPAYPQTNIKVRSLMAVTGIDYDALSAAMVKAKHGEPLEEKEINLLARASDKIRSYVPALDGAEPDGGAGLEGSELVRRLERLKFRLRYGYRP